MHNEVRAVESFLSKPLGNRPWPTILKFYLFFAQKITKLNDMFICIFKYANKFNHYNSEDCFIGANLHFSIDDMIVAAVLECIMR